MFRQLIYENKELIIIVVYIKSIKNELKSKKQSKSRRRRRPLN